MNVFRVSKRIKMSIVKFLFRNLNNSFRIMVWRKMGVKVGKNCIVSCHSLSSESYLIEIGDNVVITQNVYLITHEGSIAVFQREFPNLDLFGRIKIGNNCFIGMNSLILPNTVIGDNCIVGAGTVVRGNIPENSVVIGNPGKIAMRTDQYRKITLMSPMLNEYKSLKDSDKKKVLIAKLNACSMKI